MPFIGMAEAFLCGFGDRCGVAFAFLRFDYDIIVSSAVKLSGLRHAFIVRPIRLGVFCIVYHPFHKFILCKDYHKLS